MLDLPVLKLVSEGGIFALGWVLFIYMMVERRFERKKYAELVVQIVTYFTKVNMAERIKNADANDPAPIPLDPPTP